MVLRDLTNPFIVLDVHAPSENNIDDSRGSFDEESEHIFFIIFQSTM
jgi:hypothetical protein